MKTNVPPEQEASPSNATAEGDDTQCSPRQLARRRILKAAAGAPVVFVVNNGTATASSSSMCLDNSEALIDTSLNEPAGYVEKLSEDEVGWVRVAVEKIHYRHGNSDLFGYRLGEDRTWHMVSSPNGFSGDPEDSANNNWKLQEKTGLYYYLVAEYPGGTPVAHTESAASPVAGGSCWNSMGGVGTAIHNLLI